MITVLNALCRYPAEGILFSENLLTRALHFTQKHLTGGTISSKI